MDGSWAKQHVMSLKWLRLFFDRLPLPHFWGTWVVLNHVVNLSMPLWAALAHIRLVAIIIIIIIIINIIIQSLTFFSSWRGMREQSWGRAVFGDMPSGSYAGSKSRNDILNWLLQYREKAAGLLTGSYLLLTVTGVGRWLVLGHQWSSCARQILAARQKELSK